MISTFDFIRSVDAEALYAKSLSKMASKLSKACREVPGTTVEAWRNVAAEMESRSEVHRQCSNAMIEEIVKPLKQMIDNQHKTRKAVRKSIDRSIECDVNAWAGVQRIHAYLMFTTFISVACSL